MFRIDSFGAAPGNLFTEGNPSQGDPATKVSAEWLNYALQEELCGTVEAAGLVLSKADPTQLLQAIRALASGGSSSFNGVGSNEIVNGDFGIYQRATSAPGGVMTKTLGVATTAYAFDRWQSSPDGGGGAGNATITRQPFTLGQTQVPRSPTWFMRHAQTVASTVGAPYARQKIEGVSRYQGTYTLSVWAQATAPISCSLRVTQKFGTGGSPSGDVVAVTQAISVTTAWQRFTVTVAMPSVSGKTLGTAGDDHVLVEFLMPSAATFTVDVADVQFEASPSATGFQRRARSVELELCQRYYEKSWGADTAAATCPSSLDGAATGLIENPTAAPQGSTLLTRFRVEKRAAPAVVWFAPSNQVANRIDSEVSPQTVSSTAAAGTASTGYPVGTFAKGIGAAHWTADAEL